MCQHDGVERMVLRLRQRGQHSVQEEAAGSRRLSETAIGKHKVEKYAAGKQARRGLCLLLLFLQC